MSNLIPDQARQPVISLACRASASPAQCQRDCAGYINPLTAGPMTGRCEHVCHDTVNPHDYDRALVLARRQAGQ